MEDMHKNQKLYETLLGLEKKLMEGNFDVNLELQSHKSDIDRLREVVNELKKQELHLSTTHKESIKSVDENLSVTSRRINELIAKMDALESRLVILEEHKDKTDKRVWTYIDKMIIAIISGIMTLLLNNLI